MERTREWDRVKKNLKLKNNRNRLYQDIQDRSGAELQREFHPGNALCHPYYVYPVLDLGEL